MPCRQFMLLFCLVTAGLSSARPEADENEREKRLDDVSASDVLTLVQRQASTMDKLQADLTAYKNQVSQLQGDLTAFRTQVQGDPAAYKNKMNQVQADLTAYKTQVNQVQADLTACKNQANQVQGNLTTYKNQVTSMNSQLQVMQHKMDAASMSVAFTVRISRGRDHGGQGLAMSHHYTVVFDDVVTNIGSSYNSSNGVFSAPVSGTYVFFLQQMSTAIQGHLSLAIVKNGAVLDLIYSEGSTVSNDQGSSQVTTHVTAGQEVWVRQTNGNAVRGDWWTVFTGFLLHED